MSNQTIEQVIEQVKGSIGKLSKKYLVLVLLNKEGNPILEKQLEEKFEGMSEEQLREEILKSFKRKYDMFDVAFATLLPSYLKISPDDITTELEIVEEVMQSFEFSNLKYDDKKRRQDVIKLLQNADVISEVKDLISDLVQNEFELDADDHSKEVELIYLFVIYELLYVTYSNLNLDSFLAAVEMGEKR